MAAGALDESRRTVDLACHETGEEFDDLRPPGGVSDARPDRRFSPFAQSKNAVVPFEAGVQSRQPGVPLEHEKVVLGKPRGPRGVEWGVRERQCVAAIADNAVAGGEPDPLESFCAQALHGITGQLLDDGGHGATIPGLTDAVNAPLARAR